MEYRGIEYKVRAEPKGKWRWTVDFSETKFKTGVAVSKAAAFAKALDVIQDGPTEEPTKAKPKAAKKSASKKQ